VVVKEIDAMDGSTVLDLKAYFPVTDRVQDARYPEWLPDWPLWMPKEGIGLM
jgi:tRNA (Thr-GGU) A37 N-methylase